MAAASVRSSNVTSATNSTNLSVNLPATIVAGDLLLAVDTVDAPGTTNITTSSTGWVRLWHETQGTNVLRHVGFAKIADGSNALTIAGLNQDSSVVCLAIQDHGATDPTFSEIILITAATNTTGNADPPATGTISNQEWLIVATCGIDMTNAADTLSVQPSTYTDIARNKSANSTSSCATGVAVKAVTGTSEDPGTFTNTSRPWIAKTLAVPPSTAATVEAVLDASLGALTAAVTADVEQEATLAAALGALTAEMVATVSTWTTFDDGVSGSTGATVTGLTNDVAYEFRVAAVNSEGQGDWSNIAGPYTPTGGATTIEAVLDAALGALTAAVTADVDHDAVLAASLSALTATAVASVDHEATLAASLGALTASMTAEPSTPTGDVDATLTAALGGLSAAFTADVEHDVTLSASLGALTATATAGVDHDATLAASLGALTATVTATVTRAAVLDVPLGSLSASMTAEPETPPPGQVNAVLDASLGALTAEMTATVTPPVQATLSAPLGALTASMTATVAEPIEATLSAPLGALTAGAAATVDHAATLAAGLGALVAVMTAVASEGAPQTELRTRRNGREPATTLTGRRPAASHTGREPVTVISGRRDST